MGLFVDFRSWRCSGGICIWAQVGVVFGYDEVSYGWGLRKIRCRGLCLGFGRGDLQLYRGDLWLVAFGILLYYIMCRKRWGVFGEVDAYRSLAINHM